MTVLISEESIKKFASVGILDVDAFLAKELSVPVTGKHDVCTVCNSVLELVYCL